MSLLPSADGRSAHFLAINHDPAVLTLFRDLLSEKGDRVTTRSSRDHDLTAITRLAPDLIVLDDLGAQEDDSGALLQLLRLDPTICTGTVQEGTALTAHLETLGVRLVRTPSAIERLLAVLAAALAARGQESPAGGEEPATARWVGRAELLHALRTPLTVALGRTQLLRRQLARGDPPHGADLAALEDALERLRRAVERVDAAWPD